MLLMNPKFKREESLNKARVEGWQAHLDGLAFIGRCPYPVPKTKNLKRREATSRYGRWHQGWIDAEKCVYTQGRQAAEMELNAMKNLNAVYDRLRAAEGR
jgi:hypothetical protein